MYGFTILRDYTGEEAITVEDMRAYELNAVASGIPLLLLMENAGRSVADYVEYRLSGVRGKRIVVLAGKGGNAGDGFVAARHLAGRGALVEVHLTYPPSEVEHPDARLNLEVLARLDSVTLKPPYSRGWLEVQGCDAVIDALLGTGVKGPLKPPILDAAREFNKAPCLKVAVDVPSGVDPDSGDAAEGSVRADATVTMHRVKRGLLKARDYAGELVVASIGLTGDFEEYAGPGDVESRVPRRPREARKGDGGRVLVVAGSRYYVGAAVLAASGAARSGVDLVYLASTRGIAESAAARVSTIIPLPFEGEVLTPSDADRLTGMLGRIHSLAIGPGLGRDPGTVNAVCRLLESVVKEGVPAVVDADALHALRERGVRLSPQITLTPHRGEAAMLLDAPEGDPMEMASRIAAMYNATVIVKAPVDAACTPNGRCRRNRSGVPAMSVGGTGDVLTGVIAGIIAKRRSIIGDEDPLNSAITGAYIVGKAGELAFKKLGESITAYDVLEEVPRVLRDPLSNQ